ncbi:MAG: hypothetical protein RIS35_3007 [Pseudomonadota bacterium]|jgi:pyrroline-5-carboxylate reductase
MRITFIGGGNMASALIGGILDRTASTGIAVVDPVASQRELLAQRFGVATHAAPVPAALDCDVLVMAIKPQQMREAALAIAPHIGRQLVVSVAAGIRAGDLSRWLGGHQRIVRCMPNTPALVGAGITGLAAMPGLPDDDRAIAESLLAAVGQTLWVDEESMLDAVTAVSGSGPAYVFYFMEAIEAAAVRMGFDAEQARTLTLATFMGAAKLAAQSPEPASVLRERVTSKGGTTAAALDVMARRDLPSHIADALQAACARSVELGDEFGRD